MPEPTEHHRRHATGRALIVDVPSCLVCPKCGASLNLRRYQRSQRPISMKCPKCPFSFDFANHRAIADTARARFHGVGTLPNAGKGPPPS